MHSETTHSQRFARIFAKFGKSDAQQHPAPVYGLLISTVNHRRNDLQARPGKRIPVPINPFFGAAAQLKALYISA
eukprot:8314444-Alexandrium_andersonii.AAC.1